jgi:hypothetical protein
MSTQNNRIAVPRLIKFSGTFSELSGSAASGPVEVTFALYKQEADQEPIWTETQTVQFDAKGNYNVLLGATQPEGVPVELFSAAEAHWLGVEIQGQPQQPRTLLVSVPYALKAVEAEKLAGKSLSDFVLSENLGDQVRQVIQQQGQASPPSAPAVASAATTTSGSSSKSAPALSPSNPPSVFAGSTTNQIVLVQQKGTGAGLVSLTPQNTALAGHSNGGTASIGVFGQSGGANGNGVFGIATSPSTSTFQNGVFGQTNGAGSGVAGIANSPSAVGVYGQTAGFAAVFGNNVGTSGFVTGVAGNTSSPTGSGVAGTSNIWVGVGGQATATSGGPAFGVWGDTLSTDGVGVAAFADATSGPSIALYGSNVSTGGSAIYGTEFATSGGTAGVVGQVMSPNGTAGVFANLSGQGLLLQGISGSNSVFTVDAGGNLTISGNLVVNGTKSSTAKLQDGREVALYAVESPENWFEDFGSGQLNKGVAFIPLDASFAQATNATVAYHVFLTPNGDSNGLYVARKTPSGFEVREHTGGASSVAFDYRIVVRRRGYESVRMAEFHRPKTQVSTQLLNKKPMKIQPVSPKQMSVPPVAASR